MSNLFLKKSPQCLLVNWSHASLSLLLQSFILVSMHNCPSQQFKLITSVTKEKKHYLFFCSYFLYIWRLQFISNVSQIQALWLLNLSSGAMLSIHSPGGNKTLFQHFFLVLVCATSLQVHKDFVRKDSKLNVCDVLTSIT